MAVYDFHEVYICYRCYNGSKTHPLREMKPGTRKPREGKYISGRRQGCCVIWAEERPYMFNGGYTLT